MENALLVFVVAMSPFVVAAVVWRSMSMAHRVAASPIVGSSSSAGPPAFGGWRSVATGAGALVALIVLVGSMSVVAAVVLGLGGAVAAAVVRMRGAIEPRIDVHSAAFDERLRGFLDDAA